MPRIIPGHGLAENKKSFFVGTELSAFQINTAGMMPGIGSVP